MNRLFFVIFGLLGLLLNAQNLEQKIERLNSVPKNEVSDSIKSISNNILSLRKKDAQENIKKLLLVINELKLESHLNTLIFTVVSDSSRHIAKLDSIYILAEKDNLTNIMGWVMARKGEYFKERGKLDSSMVCILRARDIFTELDDRDKLVSVKQTLADLYYAAGDYEEAENMYLEIQQIKGNQDLWETWRKQTIRNNLALIDIKKNNYKGAIQKFNQSLLEVTDRKAGKTDSISLAYIYSELAKLYLLEQNYDKFQYSYKNGIFAALKYGRDKFSAELFFSKSKYHFQKEEVDSSLKYALLAEQFSTNTSNSLGLNSEITTFLANLYLDKNDFEKSVIYFQKSIAFSDSLIKSQIKQKHMQLLAEDEYQNLQYKFEKKANELRLVLIIGVLSLFVIGIIIFLYFKLQNAYRILVKKSIKLESNEKAEKKPIITTSNISESNMLELTGILEKRMMEEKLYLDKDLTLDKLAEILDTNRTYLSKSINELLKVNFTTYINNFRIKEAIEFIKSDYLKQYNLEGIGNKCGFKSRSGFFKAFKLYTGVTPSFFIKNYDALQ